jgi:hypothetical protein
VQEAFDRYQLKSPLARVLSLIHEQAAPSAITLDVGERLDAQAWQRQLDEAIAQGACVGVAFARGDTDTIFGQTVQMALAFEACVDGKVAGFCTVAEKDDPGGGILSHPACLFRRARSQGLAAALLPAGHLPGGNGGP